jgi:hypothetical protein
VRHLLVTGGSVRNDRAAHSDVIQVGEEGIGSARRLMGGVMGGTAGLLIGRHLDRDFVGGGPDGRRCRGVMVLLCQL